MMKHSLLLALLATALPAQSASIGVLADYSMQGDTYIASDGGGLPGHVGAVVRPGFDGADNFIDLADPFLAIPPPEYPIGQAQANGNAGGDIAVQAGFLAPRGGPADSLRARAVWSETVVNLSGMPQA